MFSRRTPSRTEENRLARALAARTRPYVDLTATNPTTAGLDLGGEEAAALLADPRAATYAPDPRGLLSAREAVSRYYGTHGVPSGVRDPGRIVLTASSSEAYSWLLKLLASPGDAVLVPAPSYPLLDALAGLESVALRRYPLPPEEGFAVDPHLVAEAVARCEKEGRRVAAVVLVAPNNPTGTGISRGALAALARLAAEKGFAIVSDEVFLDYRYAAAPEDDAVAAAAAAQAAEAAQAEVATDALVFSLGGLSKCAALPQLKLGWILAGGPEPLLSEALHRLEWIADAFLSVGTPVQVALPRLLELAPRSAAAVRERVLRNEAALRAAFGSGASASAVTVLPVPAGWAAVLRVPATTPEEELVLDLLEGQDLLVHPGHFFEFPHEAFLVLSLLPEPSLFDEGVRRLEGALSRQGGSRLG